MPNALQTFLRSLPVLFGFGFLGPVLAEIYLRTPLHEFIPITDERSYVYAGCMLFGALYGVIAIKTGRWV